MTLKFKIVMISNENCIHCINAQSVLNKFVEVNSKLIELKVIEAETYKKTNVFGQYSAFPVFIFISKSGNYKKFDFINDGKTERTYEKLKSVVVDLSKLY
jgi:hypothetical protein